MNSRRSPADLSTGGAAFALSLAAGSAREAALLVAGGALEGFKIRDQLAELGQLELARAVGVVLVEHLRTSAHIRDGEEGGACPRDGEEEEAHAQGTRW